MFFINAVGPT